MQNSNGSATRKHRSRAKASMSAEVLAFPAAAEHISAAATKELNARYAFVRVGSKSSVLDTYSTEPTLMRVKDFEDLEGNHRVTIPGKRNPVAKASIWLIHEDRRTYYGGITFAPGGPTEVNRPEGLAYNLWRGWAVEPDPTAPQSSYQPFLDHIHDVVCNGNQKATDWVIDFLADIVQRPMVKIGVALVLRGTEEGSGKTTVPEVMGKILGPHYTMLDKSAEITGQFNAAMERTLLVCADEAVWGGDKNAAGALKSLVTARRLSIRRLYHDSVMQPNYTRLIFCSNESWVVPAGVRARRFTVLDVPPTRVGDSAYFTRLWSALEANGGEGYRGLLAWLLARQIDYGSLRTVLQTDALTEQQLLGLRGDEQWWYEILQTGTLPRAFGHLPNETFRSDLQEAYLHYAGDIGIRHRAAATQIGAMLHRWVPGLRSGTDRVRDFSSDGHYIKRPYYIFPSLTTCRQAFVHKLGGHIAWDDPDSDWDPRPPEPTPPEPDVEDDVPF